LIDGTEAIDHEAPTNFEKAAHDKICAVPGSATPLEVS
jgi:hypothetical protein